MACPVRCVSTWPCCWPTMPDRPTPHGTARFNYHPAYGVTDEIRSRAVAIAREHDVSMAVALTGFGRSTIYRWRADASKTDNPTSHVRWDTIRRLQ
jgi:hypothetical protein